MRIASANSAPPQRGDFVASLAAGLRVLAAFTVDRPEMGIGELARFLEMDKRRTQRLVSTLYELGYLDQDPETRRYRPGVAVLTLGYAALGSLDINRLARPHLSALLEQFGQSVNLGVRHRQQIVFVDCLRGERYRLGVNVHVGDGLPIHLSSMGKALLSRLPDEEYQTVVDALVFNQLTEHSVGSRTALEEQLAVARERGYAVMDQETTQGVRSVAAPVLASDGYPVAAVNVVMPTPLVSLAEMEEAIAPAVVAAAGRISRLLAADHRTGHELAATGPGPSR